MKVKFTLNGFSYLDDFYGFDNAEENMNKKAMNGSSPVIEKIINTVEAQGEEVYDMDVEGYNRAVADKYIDKVLSVIHKEIPEFNMAFDSSKMSNLYYGYMAIQCVTDDFDIINKWYDDHQELFKDFRNKVMKKPSTKSGVVEAVLEKLMQDESLEDIDWEDFAKDINYLDYVSANLDIINEYCIFKPELTDIQELKYYIEKDGEFVWNKDVEGQQKLPLKYENLNKLINEALS